MPNAYSVDQVKTFIPEKTWNELPDEMQTSAAGFCNQQQLPGYYLIVPPFRADDLALLVEGQGNQVGTVMLQDGTLVVPLELISDTSTFGYAHEFLSGLTIRKVEDSEFPVSDV